MPALQFAFLSSIRSHRPVTSNLVNIHATAVVLGTQGVLIRGQSGRGKSALAIELIEAWRMHNQFARWVSDDRVLISEASSRLVAFAPEETAGLSEIRFGGIQSVIPQTAAVLDLVVDLESSDKLERLPKILDVSLIENGPKLQRISVPFDNLNHAVRIIEKLLIGQILELE